MHSALRGLDLNLLLVFDALYRHGSVTRAASELAISPSAFSHALNRLRESLDDPLFLRSGKRMLATAKAESMAVTVAAALGNLSACLQEPVAFSAASSTRCFTFAVTDYTAAVILPELIAAIHRIAPQVTLRLVYSREFNANEDLLSGRVDFALGYEEEQMPLRHGIESIDCLTDDYVVAVRRAHPDIGATLSREAYLAAGHVVVRPWNHARGTIDRYLDNQQVRRRIVVELPSVMIAPVIVARSDLLITLPRRGVFTLFNMDNLRCFPPPFPTPQYVLKTYFSPALCHSPAHQWMLEQIRLAARAIGDGAGRV